MTKLALYLAAGLLVASLGFCTEKMASPSPAATTVPATPTAAATIR